MPFTLKSKQIPTNKQELENILLANRGLGREWFETADPATIPLSAVGLDADKIKTAVDIIRRHRHDEFVIAGDYDADGCCASYILWDFLRHLNIHADIYIPDRIKDGYGLSLAGAETVINSCHPKVVITVDNGITAVKEIAYFREHGAQVILTDHHRPESYPPQPDAIVHSLEICGTAVIWFFMRELARGSTPAIQELVMDYLPFVAITTITDVMKLSPVNKSLIRAGFARMKEGKFRGLVALLREAKVSANTVNSYDIGFTIGPCINAIGRVEGDVTPVIEMLQAPDGITADARAMHLVEVNEKRKKLQKEAVKQVEELVNPDDKIIVVKSKVDAGLMGPIANGIMEKFNKPTFIFNDQGDRLKGSARSIDGVDIVKIIRSTIATGGGHTKAAGLSVDRKDYDTFVKQIADLSQKLEYKEVVKYVDCQLDVNKIDPQDIIEVLEEFEPYGEVNARPTVMCKGVVETFRYMGSNDEHFKFTIGPMQFVFWNINPKDMPQDGDEVEVYGSLGINRWNNKTDVQIAVSELNIVG